MNFNYQSAVVALFLSSLVWTIVMFALTGFSLWTGIAGLLTTASFILANALQNEDTEDLTEWDDG